MNFLRLLLCDPSNLEFLLHDARLGLRSQFLDSLLVRSCVVMMFFVVLMVMLVAAIDRLKRLFQQLGQKIGVRNFVAAEKLLIFQMSILRRLRFLLMHRLINRLVATVALPQVRRKCLLYVFSISPVTENFVL